MRLITFKSAILARCGQDLVLHALGEEGVRFFFAQIFKRQDCDAFLEHMPDTDRSRAAQKEKLTADNCPQHEQRDCNRRPAHMSAVFLNCLKLLRRCGVAHSIARQIYDTDADAVLHFALTKIVQKRAPPRILLQIFPDMP